MTAVPAEKTQLILPPAEFADDEELLTWMEVCRKICLKAADELDEDATYIYGKLRLYAREQGMRGFAAAATARAVALPISRNSERMEDLARAFRMGANRVEAFLDATEGRSRRRESGFTVKGNRGRR